MEFLEILFFVSVWQRFAWTGHKLFSCLCHMIFGYANRKKTKDTPLKTTRESSYVRICQMWDVITITSHWEHWEGLESCPWTNRPAGKRHQTSQHHRVHWHSIWPQTTPAGLLGDPSPVHGKCGEHTAHTYLTSASGLLSWLLGMQFSIRSLWALGLLLAHFCFFSFLLDEEGMLPFVALWLRGEEFTTPLAFL